MEKLNGDILEEIFGYLDVASLKNTVEVSKRWSAVIKTSHRIGKNLAITIKSGNVYTNVDIPINGLKYGHLIIKGHPCCSMSKKVHRFCFSKKKNMQESLNSLKRYEGSIRKATFQNDSSIVLADISLKEITQLIMNQSFYNCPLVKNDQEWNSFENLNQLELNIDSSQHDLKVLTLFGWINFEKLTHLKIFVRSDIDSYISKEFVENLIAKKNREGIAEITIKNLKLRGINYEIFKNLFISIVEYLDTLELELNKCEEYLDSIKLQKGSKDDKEWKTWNKLIFKNATTFEQKLINDILNNHQDVSTITFEYDQPNAKALLPAIPNLQKIEFKFADGMKRSFHDFTQVHLLEIRRLDNDAQLLNLTDFLKKCTHLKVMKLNLISSRVKLTPRVIKSLLNAVSYLETLHIEAYSDRFKITNEAMNMIKKEGKNIRKFSLIVDINEAEKLRDQTKIFNNTRTEAIVMEKTIVPTCLENAPKNLPNEPALCIWKK